MYVQYNIEKLLFKSYVILALFMYIKMLWLFFRFNWITSACIISPLNNELSHLSCKPSLNARFTKLEIFNCIDNLFLVNFLAKIKFFFHFMFLFNNNKRLFNLVNYSIHAMEYRDYILIKITFFSSSYFVDVILCVMYFNKLPCQMCFLLRIRNNWMLMNLWMRGSLNFNFCMILYIPFFTSYCLWSNARRVSIVRNKLFVSFFLLHQSINLPINLY
jgi:hypothetical protein